MNNSVRNSIQSRPCVISAMTDRRRNRSAYGFTLVEILTALMLTSLLTIVLGGLASAVHTARAHIDTLENSTLQSQAALDRIRYMISQAGVYRLDGASTQVGIATVSETFDTNYLPTTLVVWSGGRSGGMANSGELARLPVASELLAYTYDSNSPNQLIEIAFGSNSTSIDFAASTFAADIRTLIASNDAEALVLSDRLRQVELAPSGGGDPWSIGMSWFDITVTPTDTAIQGVSPGTTAWQDLGWPQGLSTGTNGTRQVDVVIELQLMPSATETDASLSIPFYGVTSYRYVYHP